MYKDLRVKYMLFLSEFNSTWNFFIEFWKTSNIKFHEYLLSGSQAVPWGQIDKWEYRHDKANNQFCNFAKVPKKSCGPGCEKKKGKEAIWLCSMFFLPINGNTKMVINPLKPELNPICYLLALLGVHHFLHVSRIRVKSLTFRLLMSYIYGAPILDVSRSHTTTQHSR